MYKKTDTTLFYFWILVLAFLPGCFSEKSKESLKEGLFVVNVLDKKHYDDCHITGSIHVSIDKLESFASTLDKERSEVIFYCSNYMCTTSGFAAKKLMNLGFKNVAAYEGGTAEWYQRGLPTEGPAQESYLKMVINKPAQEDDVIPLIEADILADKMGLTKPSEEGMAA